VVVGGGGSGYGKMSPDTILLPPPRKKNFTATAVAMYCVLIIEKIKTIYDENN